jgi:ketosteroid isomerase-like protein
MPVSIGVMAACSSRSSDGSTNGTSTASRPERVIDCGDDVLVVAREHGRGAMSGTTVSARNYWVITIREGKILRYREFYDEAAALEAVGLSEQAAHADS